MATLKVEIDCTKLTCGACLLRPNLDSVAPMCPMFMGPESKLIGSAGGSYLRCRACEKAELESAPWVVASWTPSFAAWIVAFASAFITITDGSWWAAAAAMMYTIWGIQFMPTRKEKKS